nr:acidic proline-rich protein PRP25-like [Penaeus vannamei]
MGEPLAHGGTFWQHTGDISGSTRGPLAAHGGTSGSHGGPLPPSLLVLRDPPAPKGSPTSSSASPPRPGGPPERGAHLASPAQGGPPDREVSPPPRTGLSPLSTRDAGTRIPCDGRCLSLPFPGKRRGPYGTGA